MTSPNEGFLVVLSDVKSGHDRDYLSWLTTEHVQERLGIPGFLAVRIFRKSIAGGHRYLIWYRLQSASVVDSPAYLERLNNPTPWSSRIMPVLENFGRGGGKVAASVGDEAAEHILAIELAKIPADPTSAMSCVKSLSEFKSAHLLVTDFAKSAIQTNEGALRTSNDSFTGVLIIESESQKSLDEAAVFVSAMLTTLDSSRIGGVYREVFSLAQ